MTLAEVAQKTVNLKKGVRYSIVKAPPVGTFTVVRETSFPFSIELEGQEIAIGCDITRIRGGRILIGGLRYLYLGGTTLNCGSNMRFSAGYNPVSHEGWMEFY